MKYHCYQKLQPEEVKLAPAIIVIAPPLPELELVSIAPAPAAVIILVFKRLLLKACPEKLSAPEIVTEPAVL